MILGIGVGAGLLFQKPNPAEELLRVERDKLRHEIDGVKVELKKKEMVLLEKDRRINKFDSLDKVRQNETLERELEFARERDNFRRQLKQMTVKQKEDLLKKRYETTTP